MVVFGLIPKSNFYLFLCLIVQSFITFLVFREIDVKKKYCHTQASAALSMSLSSVDKNFNLIMSATNRKCTKIGDFSAQGWNLPKCICLCVKSAES